MEETIPDKVVAIIRIYKDHLIDSEGDLVARNQMVEEVGKLCQSCASNHGGQSTRIPASMGIGDAFKIEIDVQSVEIVRDIVEQAGDDMNVRLCAGVGHDIVEAKYAVENAEHEGPRSIKVYHPDMEESSEESSEDMNKSEGGKSEAIKLLDKIKASLPVFEQMKQERPELYQQAIVMMEGMIQAVAEQKGIELKESDGDDAARIEYIIAQFQRQHDESENEEVAGSLADQVSVHPKEEPQAERSPESFGHGFSQQFLDSVWRNSTKDKDEAEERPDFDGTDDPEFGNALFDVIMGKR